MLKIGELDRRIVLENYTSDGNSYGEQTLTWATYRTVWAKILYRGGKVDDESQEIVALSKVEFFVRNLDIAGLTAETRISYDSKYFYIEAINEVDGRGEFLQLLTKEKS